jgi:Flp pilus assembly pilin Flp
MTRTLSRRLARFLKHEDGVTAVECALLLALVVAICLVALAPAAASADAAPQPAVVLESDSN